MSGLVLAFIVLWVPLLYFIGRAKEETAFKFWAIANSLLLVAIFVPIIGWLMK